MRIGKGSINHGRYAELSISALLGGGLLALLLDPSPALAHDNQVSISVNGGERCITSNGLPNHSTGRFPNSGNPHRISEQNVRLCVSTTPRKRTSPRMIRGSIGVGINGVQFRPGTADYYDPGSRRGFSRNSASGWNLDGLGARKQLGMDRNNAHVDERGLYHYHGIANALVQSGKGSLIGWAADGFEIHYAGNSQRSSYRLKSGQRSGGPGGEHDGTYVQDWQYVPGSGTLDQCNGGKLNGKFVYFATDTFPFLPHCLWGNVSPDFAQRGGRTSPHHMGRQRSQSAERRRGARPTRMASNHRGPPGRAIAACGGQQTGQACSFRPPFRVRSIRGTCQVVQNNQIACVPRNGRPRRP